MATPEKTAYTTVDEYIATFPPERQDILRKVRETIREAAPNATEKISWQMPTYHEKENLVHFAMQKNHLGLYPGAEAVADFTANGKLGGYKTSKGSIQLPLAKPIPYDLIREITLYRVKMVE